jgi:hypothetical protein
MLAALMCAIILVAVLGFVFYPQSNTICFSEVEIRQISGRLTKTIWLQTAKIRQLDSYRSAANTHEMYVVVCFHRPFLTWFDIPWAQVAGESHLVT